MPEPEYVHHFSQGNETTDFIYPNVSGDPFSFVSTRARIALYDDLLSAPRIVDIDPAPVIDFIEHIASKTYEFAQSKGGSLPYSAIREIAENFIHAQFKECTVSILNDGNTIRFSDQGPGIEKKLLVQQPGVTSATAEMKRFIRGVGSGFPIVREYLEYRNGFLSIDDNAHEGTIITLSIQPETPAVITPHPEQQIEKKAERPLLKTLDKRSVKVLTLMYEEGVIGPNDLMEPLQVSASTAHRILVELERKGLVEATSHRKRILSNAGLALLEAEGLRG